jgi:hypothetical protein
MIQTIITIPIMMTTARIARKRSMLLFDPSEPPPSVEIVIEPDSLAVSPP